jgi:hypothetical protein
MNEIPEKSGNVAFLSSDEALEFLRSQVGSRRWWVIIPTGRAGNDLVQAFESHFYGGDRNIGFEVTVLPLAAFREGRVGAVMVAFALKQYCSPSELAEWLSRQGYPTQGDALARREFHFWCSPETSSFSTAI